MVDPDARFADRDRDTDFLTDSRGVTGSKPWNWVTYADPRISRTRRGWIVRGAEQPGLCLEQEDPSPESEEGPNSWITCQPDYSAGCASFSP